VRDAIDRETQLKKWSRAKKIELNPRWIDLADDVLGQEEISRLRST
jgi:predicted GIY-YIG superfamily endonuclease